jgi:hypothetical protein
VRDRFAPGTRRASGPVPVIADVRYKMMAPETTHQGLLQKVCEALHAFYPLILSVVATPLILKFDVFWVGILLGIFLLVLKNTWWTCIFGLLNAMAVVAMMLACVVTWIASNKYEKSNNAVQITPVPAGLLA